MDLRARLDEAVKARPKGDLASNAGAGAFARYCARIALESMPCLCRPSTLLAYEKYTCNRCALLASLDGKVSR